MTPTEQPLPDTASQDLVNLYSELGQLYYRKMQLSEILQDTDEEIIKTLNKIHQYESSTR